MSKTQLAIGIMSCLLTIGANARILSPRQEFEVDVRNRYSSMFSQQNLNQYLRDLPWSLEQLQKAERLLEADAIRMAVAFHDYSGLLRLTDEEIVLIAPKILKLLNGEFQGFWLKLSDSSRKLLFDNPELIQKTIQILQSMSDSADADEYKRLLADHPDALVFLYRFPSLIRVPREQLPILLHFLQHVSLSDQHSGALTQLDGFIAAWKRELIPLYVANMEQYGPAPVLTMWAVPEFFSNRNPDLSVDLKRNQLLWSVLLSQIGFIRDRQKQSLDWLKDVAALSGLINRQPQAERLSNGDWLYALLQTAPANGKLLKFYWELHENIEAMRKMDEFLLRLKDINISFAILLDLLKFCENSHDYLFMLEVVQAPVYKESGRAMQPLLILSELLPDREGQVLRMLKRHREKLLVYLSDSQRGKSVRERWSLAQKTNLKDVDYDESTMKMLITKFPGGNLANVAIKAFSGYPVSGIEATLAAVDVARGMLYVATMGGSEVAVSATAQVAGETAKQTASGAAQQATGAAASATAKATTEEATKLTMKKLKDNAISWIQENRALLVESLNVVEDVSREIDITMQYYEYAGNNAEFIKIEQRMFEQSNRDHLAMQKDVLMFERFDHLPLRKSTEERQLLMTSGGERVQVDLPSSPRDWIDGINGKSKMNAILLVTLGDLR